MAELNEYLSKAEESMEEATLIGCLAHHMEQDALCQGHRQDSN